MIATIRRTYLRKGDKVSINTETGGVTVVGIMEDDPNNPGQLRVQEEIMSPVPIILLTESLEVAYISRYSLATMPLDGLLSLRGKCRSEIEARLAAAKKAN